MRVLTALAVATLAAAPTLAHNGRRMEIKIVNDALVAQGYNSTGEDDGAGVVRPYYNAIHDHWENLGAGLGATADLPGFDIFEAGPLVGHSVTLTLNAGFKWVDPPLMPPAGTVPDLTPLDGADEVFVTLGLDSASTNSPGPLTLSASVPAGGAEDIDLTYDIGVEPSGVIYVLEFTLSTTAPGVEDSSTVYILLSPDGATPEEKLHPASLYLEQYLGTPSCAADLAEPFGTLDFSDVLAFLTAFGSGSPEADLAEPFGTFDFSDVLEFLTAFGDGCP
ncbi:MAG: GC-type dockerin domain-anchored protein [Phycisphaerales bacterium]